MICYASQSEKRQKWPLETLPAIFKAARHATRNPHARAQLQAWMQSHGVATAEDLHNAARAGRYVATPEPRRHCDPIQPVARTIAHGGDCDQWAAVLLAGLAVLGFDRLWLISVGDEADPYRHVAVMLHAEDRYWRLDPKADQQGVDFNQRADNFNVQQYHRFTP